MESEDFFRVITEFEFICEDIDEIKEQIDLTKSEVQKISQAITSIENAKNILADLFPKIESLKNDVREDLTAEFADIG
jgi:prefoldin subunit 5